MNYTFYHALQLTSTFFHLFDGVRYRGVPVARAMFYDFHREAVDYFSKRPLKPKKNWAAQKKKLYKMLIASERVKRIPYRPNRNARHKVIYSPYSYQGLPLRPTEAIACAPLRSERSYMKGSKIPFCVPPQMRPLNATAYRQCAKQIRAITKRKNIQYYFRRASFTKWMIRQLKTTIRTIDGIHQLFQANRIRGVILHSSVHPLGFLLIHMAKQRGIYTAIQQYGINDDYQIMSTYARHYITWGSNHQKKLEQYGIPRGKFVQLGCPRMDALFKYKAKSKARLAKLFRFPRSRMVFFYAEQPLNRRQNKVAMRHILRALNPHRRRVILLVKEHPRQKSGSLSRRELRRYRFVRKVTNQRVHLYDLIKNANGVFTQFSTVGIEAMLMNRPVIALNLFKNTMKHEFSYYSASPLVTSARNQRQLNRVMKKFVRNIKYRRHVLRRQQKYRKATYRGTLSAVRVKKFINARTR